MSRLIVPWCSARVWRFPYWFMGAALHPRSYLPNVTSRRRSPSLIGSSNTASPSAQGGCKWYASSVKLALLLVVWLLGRVFLLVQALRSAQVSPGPLALLLAG